MPGQKSTQDIHIILNNRLEDIIFTAPFHFNTISNIFLNFRFVKY